MLSLLKYNLLTINVDKCNLVFLSFVEVVFCDVWKD